jgi:ADP-ribose pyrophosphatase
MYSIIIADGLTNDFCSVDPQFQNISLNIGIDEINRVWGEGELFGKGVIPTFLKSAIESKSADLKIGLILLRDYHDPSDPDQQEEFFRYGEHGIIDSKGADFAKPVDEFVPSSEVINTSTLAMPLDKFQNAVINLFEIDPLSGDQDLQSRFKILLIGFHTEKRILSTAHILRNVIGFKYVAVCPHLVGSSNRDAHFTALRNYFPDSLIQVIPELNEAASFIGIKNKEIEKYSLHACHISPNEIRNKFNSDQRMIVEVLCMHWTHAELKELKGGYSGSFLFLANGRKGEFRTEPMVIKIDSHLPIRKEIKGYNRVKDLLGIHVPTLSPPVKFGKSTGIGMELATMEGQPKTLQDYFEMASNDAGLELFLRLFDRTLSMLVTKVYKNTLSVKSFVPYRQFLLHINDQERWLKGNLESIRNQQIGDDTINTDMIENMFSLVRKNDDGIQGEMSLSHGDLNFANIICDNRENIWAIDWTYADTHPLVLDFTKMENDTKFVMSKQFESEDFPKLLKFEEYLLSNPIPADLENLPKSIQFVKWDLRFKKILLTVRKIRAAYFSIKGDEEWLVYKIALLKYSIHNLSFDKSRNRGECEAIQLWYALCSVDHLLFQLVADDFHLKIRGERPKSYPPRFRISIDQASWKIEVPDYQPPYHVDDKVLKNDITMNKNGWADPEDDWQIRGLFKEDISILKDDKGKPLNPHGRTGISSRGLLGHWGPNPYVIPIITRINPETNVLEILIHESDDEYALLEDFTTSDRTFGEATKHLLKKKYKLNVSSKEYHLVYDGYLYDPRQTDNAWIVAQSYLLHQISDISYNLPDSVGSYNVRWKLFNAELVNEFSSSRSLLLRNVIQKLHKQKIIGKEMTEAILKKTG